MFCFISNNVVVIIYLVLLEVAAKKHLAKLNGPLGDAVAESLEKSIRSIDDSGAGLPPANQP